MSYYTYCSSICFVLNKYTLGIKKYKYKKEIWMILVEMEENICEPWSKRIS